MREADNHFTVGFDRDAAFPVQVAGLNLKGGLMYAGVNGNPTTQGKPLNGVAPRGGMSPGRSATKTVIRGGYGFYLGADAVSGTRRNGDRRARLHGHDDLSREHGRRPDAGGHAVESVPDRHHAAAGQRAGPRHRRRRRHRLRRSEFAAGLRAAVLGRLPARAAAAATSWASATAAAARSA